MDDRTQLNNLGQATLPCDDCSDGALDRGHFALKVLYLLYYDWAVLLGGEAVDAVEKDCAVVVRDEVGFPRFKQLLLEAVDHVCRYVWH